MSENMYIPKSITTKKLHVRKVWWLVLTVLAEANSVVFGHRAVEGHLSAITVCYAAWAVLTLIVAVKGVLTMTSE